MSDSQLHFAARFRSQRPLGVSHPFCSRTGYAERHRSWHGPKGKVLPSALHLELSMRAIRLLCRAPDFQSGPVPLRESRAIRRHSLAAQGTQITL